ncbi:MAG TPA: enterochelin esterase, partial [Alphaproteobacteria bacterium]|nr:enterochelin esterase [Alphaproteobacteria bacterium]
VAMPDCFTRLGGNQYINSPAMGPWADYLLTECVPFVELSFACGGTGRRGLFGKSSGGYGAIVHALLYPHFWAAAAVHSGDMAHELCHLPEFPKVLRALAKTNNSIETWLKDFFAKPKTADSDVHILMMLAMCASYDPDPGAYMGIRLPVDMDTCEVIPERWKGFVDWDPLTLAVTHAQDLKTLKALHIDCGTDDQYNLVYGA